MRCQLHPSERKANQRKILQFGLQTEKWSWRCVRWKNVTLILLFLRSSDTPPDELKSLTLVTLKLESLIAALVKERKELEAVVSERKTAVTAEKYKIKKHSLKEKESRYPCFSRCGKYFDGI
jgi:hypothetical protein